MVKTPTSPPVFSASAMPSSSAYSSLSLMTNGTSSSSIQLPSARTRRRASVSGTCLMQTAMRMGGTSWRAAGEPIPRPSCLHGRRPRHRDDCVLPSRPDVGTLPRDLLLHACPDPRRRRRRRPPGALRPLPAEGPEGHVLLRPAASLLVVVVDNNAGKFLSAGARRPPHARLPPHL